MQTMNRNKTKRLHLEKPFLSSCEATVIEVDRERGIVLNQTIAYAESGGQEGDKGVIKIQDTNLKAIPFIYTKKGLGRLLFVDDFPTVHVDTPVYHIIEREHFNDFEIGMKVVVKIDIERRAKLTVSHTGIHLVLMGLEELYPDIYPRIIGCHIKETGARLDFFVEEKMTSTDIHQAQMFANRLIFEDITMTTFPHKDEPEAYYWQLKDTIYPCGGTHLISTGAVGAVEVSKKNLGKGKQRISFIFPNAVLPIQHYYEE